MLPVSDTHESSHSLSRFLFHCIIILTLPIVPPDSTIRELVRPFILQRRKRDVAASLPAKREEVVLCSMTRAQWSEYKSVLERIQGYVD